jgi:hypothetical protein
MGQYLTWLAAALRDAGLPVREVPGWQTRGHGAMHDEVAGVLVHHTAGPATGLLPSERVLVEGRTGLAGPLCNLALARDGTWVVVAAGQAWHAGTGVLPWCPQNQGNSRLIGIEGESVGTRDDWTPAQRASYPRGVAALLIHLGLGSFRVAAHREWAPSRKIDPAFWDMHAFRADVARWMTAPTGGALMALSDTEQRELLDRVRNLEHQLVLGEGGPDGRWGWRTFDGGTGETLTVVDMLRRANVRLEDAHRRLDALAAALARVGETAARPGVTPEQIRAAVTAALDEGLVRVDVSVQGRPPA